MCLSRKMLGSILIDIAPPVMAVALKEGVFIIAAKRIPFGKMRGLLRDVHPSDLLTTALKATLKDGGINELMDCGVNIIDTVNVGQVYTISGSGNGALTHRHAVLKSGLPQETPVLSINKLCGSGFQAVTNSVQDILTGAAQISIAGGTENMSQVPFLVRNLRFGTKLGDDMKFEDFLISGSLDSYCNFTMAQTSENLAEKYRLRREDLDEYAISSQQKWKAGYESGAFKAEMAPVTVTVNNQEVVMEKDEHPRPGTTMKMLRVLPATFREGGVGTAGNSTGVNNGAGAIIIANEASILRHNLTPLVRVVGWACAGVEPSLMGLGPVPAVKNLLAVTGCRLDDVDMIEINEPFAGQTLASMIELKVDPNKVNINGGAIAVGHPPAATGVRITAHLAHELRRRGLKNGIGTSCIGGGQGIALMFETM